VSEPGVTGRADPRFSAVEEAFAQAIESGADRGGAVAVAVDGEIVVDLRGGVSDKAGETPWTDETLVCVFSTGKAILSLLIAREVEAGRLDYEAPVATYWTDFAKAGKGKITVGEALSHQAGLAGFPEPMDPGVWLDWRKTTGRIAELAPLWPPGSQSGYHPQTFGYIAGELLRRADGRSFGTILREDFAAAHGIEIHCGLDPETQARAAYMAKPKQAPDLGEMNAAKKAAFLEPWSSPATATREAWMAAEIPASNVHATTSGLARMMSVLATGGRFEGEAMLSKRTIAEATKERISGPDRVLPFDLSWAAGLMRNTNGFYGPNRGTAGHSGFGGSCAFADPETGVSFAYVTATMGHHLAGDPRSLALIDATYAAL